MTIRLAFAAAAAAALLCGGAQAATLTQTNGDPLTYMIHNSTDPDGHELDMHTMPGDFPVDFTSDSILHNYGNSNGFAQVNGPGSGGGVGFTDLGINLDPESATFTAIKFKFELPDKAPAPNNAQVTFTFNTRITFANGSTQDILATVLTQDNRYLIKAAANEQIKKVFFSDLTGSYSVIEHLKHSVIVQHDYTHDYSFHAIKQVSFDAGSDAVPEPATWTSMLVGFGALGSVLRRRRGQQARA